MRPPPPISRAWRYPITAGTAALAIGVTVAWYAGVIDIEHLAESIDIRRGQLWRLLTSALPHVGPFHLIFNVYWLWVFGTLIEDVYGPVKTLAIYLMLAAGSSGAEYALLDGGVGLSGVGYGLFGLLWVLSWGARRGAADERFTDAVDQRTIGLFVVWFFLCIVTTYIGAMNVANVAHAAGAALGATLGAAIVTCHWRRLAAGAGLTVAGALCIAGATVARPSVNLSRDAGADEAAAGYEALKKNDNVAALRWYRDATRMNPRDARYWFNRSIAHQRLGQNAEAQAAYEKGLALDPSEKDIRTVHESLKR
jgi:membrane associated rhomboid family serine protease